MQGIEEVYAIREKRLKLQREVAKLEQEEKDILYDIQKEMKASGQTTYTAGDYVVELKEKEAPNVTDWPALLDYIRQTGEVDMLQKRVTDSAVKARWDAGVDLPGVTKVARITVTVTKE